MLDVLPPGEGGLPRRLPQTVKLDWKLPARLRRPVRAGLKRQRSSAAVESPEAVTFERHELYPADSEQHTSDVHREHRPKVRISQPPYAGQVVQKSVGSGQPAPVTPRRQAKPAPAKVAQPVHTPEPKAVPALLQGERDIPFDWQAMPTRAAEPAAPQAAASHTVAQPTRRLALPLHFSFWPFKREPAAERLKKKVLQRVYG